MNVARDASTRRSSPAISTGVTGRIEQTQWHHWVSSRGTKILGHQQRMSRLDSAPRTTTTSPTPRCQHYTITIDTTLSTSSEANLLTSSWRKRPLLPRLHLHSWTPRHPLTTNSTSTSLALLKPPRFPYFCFAPSRKSGRCRSLVFFPLVAIYWDQ